MVLMATHVDDTRVHTLDLIDMTVDRNAFGRQRESFEADLPIKGLDGRSVPCDFHPGTGCDPRWSRVFRCSPGWIRG